MNMTSSNEESARLTVQDELDSANESSARNRLGQFATPTRLATDILEYAKAQLPRNVKIRFIDPAVGTGSFYSALIRTFARNQIHSAVGYEIDPRYGNAAKELWQPSGLEVRMNDFTKEEAEKDGFNLLICNPPYVRHHHLSGSEKCRLKVATQNACGIDVNGLSGLYCYFLGLSHKWMANKGLAGWLIPSEFMNVNYGDQIKRYLTNSVTLLHIHRFDPNDVQFADALVSSSIIWFKKQPPPTEHHVKFTYGGSLQDPTIERYIPLDRLRNETKWTRHPQRSDILASNAPMLSDYFEIRRGLATGNNGFFILPKSEIERRGLPFELFRPILPSPRYLKVDEVPTTEDGAPALDHQLYLLDCRIEEEVLRDDHPALWKYLQEGRREGVADRYLCRKRTPWYSQEKRPAAPFLCTYLGRSDNAHRKPFRFILNHSMATAANVYLLLYPKPALEHALACNPELKIRVWDILNEICPNSMLDEGRVYGGGLHKLEPKELGKVPVRAIAELINQAKKETASVV